ncbi:MAG TPA: sulfur globule protein precursor [Pseudolabrys sp.]|nr:sulfur globule protein precursor [Pseudolabrys sp.]
MLSSLRKIGIVVAAALAVISASLSFPGTADARPRGGFHWGAHHGHWRGGHWRGAHWRGNHWRAHRFGWGFAPGFALGFGLAAAPFGFYGGPYYAYAGNCYIHRRWVFNRWGHRVLRRVRVCY